jgi:hypothetical protein
MPSSQQNNPMDRNLANIVYVSQGNPPAGGGISFSPLTKYLSAIIVFHFTLSADANVADRYCGLSVKPAAIEIPLGFSAVAVTASQTHKFTFAVGIDHSEPAGNPYHFIPISPDVYIKSSDFFEIIDYGFQAGDQISDIMMWHHRLIAPV